MSDMVNWGRYGNRLTITGETACDRQIAQTKRSIKNRTPRSPAHKTILVNNVEQDLIITAGEDLITKKVNALPDEHIVAGSMVYWNDKYWIITLVDCEDEIYQRGVMKLCNTYIRWQKADGSIIGRWGYSEDVTKFAAGVVESSIIDAIQFGIKMTLPLDEDTKILRRGRRFLIGIDEDKPNAFKLTNRNVIISNYGQDLTGETGVLTLTMMQDQLEEDNGDRTDLMIANYFEPEENNSEDNDISDDFRCEITYKGKATIRSGGSYKSFTATFYDVNNNVVNTIQPIWSLTVLPEFTQHIHTRPSLSNPYTIQIEADDCPEMVGSSFKLTATSSRNDEYNTCYSDLMIRVVSIV